MADSEVMAETSIPTFEEIPTMKVTDLRKKLKAFGLPITGNKTELVERLQEACYPSKGQESFETSQLELDESQISELDSVDDGSTPIEDENALLGHDQFPSFMNSPLEDDSKLLDSTENKPSAVSNSVIMPLKKRSLIKFDDITPVEKKISINQTNISHIDFDINTKTKPKPDETVKAADSEETEAKKVISLKSMSASERMAMRMKRFNVGGNITALTSVTNSKTASNRNSKQSIISATIIPDVEVLKKRAQRFGQNVSTVMKQIEEKEKLLKRKCKFGAHLGVSGVSSLDEQEKKKQRKERFAIS